MKILIMHKAPYRKIEYHRGLDHREHDITYIGTAKSLGELPTALNCRRIEIPGGGPAGAEVLAKVGRESGFELVVSLSEFEILEAAKVREALGVPGARYDDVLKVRDKLVMKRLVAYRGLRVPRNYSAAEFVRKAPSCLASSSALVVKPTQGASSEGVSVRPDAASAQKLLWEIASAGGDLEEYEVEDFVEGGIFHADGLVQDGRILALVVSQYVGTCLEYLSGKPLGSHQTHHSEELQDWAGRCLEAVGIADGAFHLEFIEDSRGPVFLEVANRVGGADVIRSFEAKTGIHIPSAELQLLVAKRAGSRSPLPALGGRNHAPGLFGWFVFPGHHYEGRKVKTRIPEWIKGHPGMVTLKNLPDGSVHPGHVTYQDWEVPVAGFVRGRSAARVRSLIEECLANIQVEGVL